MINERISINTIINNIISFLSKLFYFFINKVSIKANNLLKIIYNNNR